MIPAEIKYPVKNILELLRNYPVSKNRRLSIAYMMIKDLNDTERHLTELKSLIGGSGIRVNLLPYHPTGRDLHSSSSPERISGISASIRKSRGVDISAACGLLASHLK
jgi:23S rRNA (adenine2503-C2)-methyltransferase